MRRASARHIDVHVCEADVAGDPRAGLLADASNSVLEGQSGQDPRGDTRGAVVTERVQLPPTVASAQREREGEPQAAHWEW